MKGVLMHKTPQFLTENDYLLPIKLKYKTLFINTLKVKIF